MSLNKALGRPEGGASDGAENLPSFVGIKALKPFISNELAARISEPIVVHIPRGGNPAKCIPAEILPEICDVWLKARESGALSAAQLMTAKLAEMINSGLAILGIIGLIDEATGYQSIRKKDALQKILDAYLLKELAAWAKRFPDEFYEEMFRLRGWNWSTLKKPSYIGKLTNDVIYDRIAPGLLEELQQRNPKTEKGYRKGKHHQLLTDEVGHPALAQHLHAVIGLMRASSNWDGFYRLLQRAFPKKKDQFSLPLDD